MVTESWQAPQSLQCLAPVFPILAIIGFEDDAWFQHLHRMISILIGFLRPKQEYATFAYSRYQFLY